MTDTMLIYANGALESTRFLSLSFILIGWIPALAFYCSDGMKDYAKPAIATYAAALIPVMAFLIFSPTSATIEAMIKASTMTIEPPTLTPITEAQPNG